MSTSYVIYRHQGMSDRPTLFVQTQNSELKVFNICVYYFYRYHENKLTNQGFSYILLFIQKVQMFSRTVHLHHLPFLPGVRARGTTVVKSRSRTRRRGFSTMQTLKSSFFMATNRGSGTMPGHSMVSGNLLVDKLRTSLKMSENGFPFLSPILRATQPAKFS